MNALFFWLFSGGMIVCALAVVLNRNAVASALCFTFAIVFMAGLFVMLSAFFLAAVQILVTAGAVMVLFLFIIMLLDLTAMEHMPRQKIWMGCTLVLALAFLVLVARVLQATPPELNTADSSRLPGRIVAATLGTTDQGGAAGRGGAAILGGKRVPVSPLILKGPGQESAEAGSSESDQQDDTHRIGRLLFRTNVGPNQPSYVAPFEITSLLILVATIGVIVLCKQDERQRPGRREEITREAPPVEPKKETALKT